MIQLAYVSQSIGLMSQQQLLELLDQARAINTEAGVTGMLLYKDGSFIQVLEGDEEAVRAIYGRIQRDPRHENVKTLYEEPAERRDFADWAMGFHNLNGVDLTALPGYSDFMDSPDLARSFFEDLTRAKKLLLLFRSKS
jgi:hypothetical protein